MTRGLAVGVGINGRLAEQFRHVLVGALLVTAKVQKLVTVAQDGLPLFFKQGFELCDVLQNDRYKHVTGTHR